jgi:hypothetical protein
MDRANNIAIQSYTGHPTGVSKNNHQQLPTIFSAELPKKENNSTNKYPLFGSLLIIAYNLMIKWLTLHGQSYFAA